MGGLEFQNFSLQQDGFEQLVNASTHFRRDRNKRSVTTPLFRGHAVDGQLAADAIEVSTWLVDAILFTATPAARQLLSHAVQLRWFAA